VSVVFNSFPSGLPDRQTVCVEDLTIGSHHSPLRTGQGNKHGHGEGLALDDDDGHMEASPSQPSKMRPTVTGHDQTETPVGLRKLASVEKSSSLRSQMSTTLDLGPLKVPSGEGEGVRREGVERFWEVPRNKHLTCNLPPPEVDLWTGKERSVPQANR